MDNSTTWLIEMAGAVLLLALALTGILINAYIGFQVWLGNARLYFRASVSLKRFHRPTELDWRHVMLAFGAPSLGGVGVVLLAQIRYDDWRLAPVIMVVALAIGVSGAVSRFRDLKHQRRRRDDHTSLP